MQKVRFSLGFTVLFALSQSVSVHAAAPVSPLPPAETAGWSKLNEDEGIVAFRKDIKGSDIVALRGEGVVEAPLENVATVIYDTEHATEWVSDLEAAQVLRWKNPFEYVEYDHVGTPFVMKDREFVSDVVIDYNAKERTFSYVFNPTEDKDAPKTGYIRGELRNTQFLLKAMPDGKSTWVLGEAMADPKGSVPKWIVNLFQKGWPIKTIVGLREQVKRRGKTVHPKILEIIKLKTTTKAGA